MLFEGGHSHGKSTFVAKIDDKLDVNSVLRKITDRFLKRFNSLSTSVVR